MPIEIRSEPGLLAELINTAAAVPTSIPVRIASAATGSVPDGLVRVFKWVPVTAATLTIDLSLSNPISATSGAVTSELITITDQGLSANNSCDGHFEVVLVGNPLATDAYGNPIAASRFSVVTATVKNGADNTVATSLLQVNAADQASVMTNCSIIQAADWIKKITVSNVTANGCTLYVLLLARANP